MLMSIQTDIENAMATEAKARQDADNAKTSARGVWSESKTGTRYQKSLTQAFTDVVREKIESFEPGKAGSNIRAIKMLAKTEIEPELIAHLFVKALLNSLPLKKGRRLLRSSLCIRAGDIIHDELRIRFFNETKERKALLKKLFKQFDKRTYPRDWRKRTIKNYFDAEQLSWTEWDDGQKQMVGYALMLWFRDSTGLIEAQSNSQYVDPTQDFIDHVEQMMVKRVLDYTLYKPMVVKPIPWSLDNLFRGGYISDSVKHYPLVKKTGVKDAAELMTRDWSQIIPAVNDLQETPYRINKTMLSVLQWAMNERRGDMAGLPPADPRPLPPEPFGYRENEEVTKAHNLVCFKIHTFNREIKSKRQAVLMTMALAAKYKEFDAMYFPHNLDSRGRAYPIASYLSPQGPDATKSLLEFGKGEIITSEEQACWLAIACANAYGNDKVALQERADWTVDNEELIVSVANNPFSDVRWTHASEPFQFLRACLEWAGFLKTGIGFMTHMVIPVDATCSGLQHYAGMLRDEVGGRAVNLVPGLPRQDVYKDVAEVTIRKLMETKPADIKIGEGSSFIINATEVAKNLLGIGIDRKITKRQVMVVPYAGTYASCMAYTRKALEDERWNEGVVAPWDLEDRELDLIHNNMLSQHIWHSIDEVVVKAKEAMKWMTKATRAYVKIANQMPGTARQRAITWVTPDGFLVAHCNVDMKKMQMDTYLDGRVRLTRYEPTEKLDAGDMASAVAPNYVHSMDACLLRMSVIKARSLPVPITSFCMIHDSFGVHATRMGEFLSACIRPSFVKMYERDVLADFRDRLLLTPDLELDPLPTKGTLDLQGVLESEFFFS
jgi:DNA-directed RNA polymerase